MTDNNRRFILRQSLLLLLTATIWGFAFVAQSVGMEHIGPFTFNAVRFFLGALTLSPFIAAGRIRSRKNKSGADGNTKGRVLRAGILCGIALGIASNLQQFGILYTSVGEAVFLAAMFIVVVPLLGICAGRRVGRWVRMAVICAAAGLYFLCMSGGEAGLGKGDALCIACAVVFAIQILLIDHFSGGVDGILLSAVQFLTAGSISALMMLLTEHPSFAQLYAARLPVLYAGILSCGVAYTLQVLGQKGMNPTVASLIMSLESPVSVLAGFLLLGQALTSREFGGCALMACAIILAQLPDSGAERRIETQGGI